MLVCSGSFLLDFVCMLHTFERQVGDRLWEALRQPSTGDARVSALLETVGTSGRATSRASDQLDLSAKGIPFGGPEGTGPL